MSNEDFTFTHRRLERPSRTRPSGAPVREFGSTAGTQELRRPENIRKRPIRELPMEPIKDQAA